MSVLSDIWPYVVAIIPTAGVAFLFYVIIRNMLEGDRKERIAHAQWEREQDRLEAAERDEAEKGK